MRRVIAAFGLKLDRTVLNAFHKPCLRLQHWQSHHEEGDHAARQLGRFESTSQWHLSARRTAVGLARRPGNPDSRPCAEWQPWLPPEGHPSWKDFKILLMESMGQEYGNQKELLDRLHQEKGEDIFVASYGGGGDQQGNLFSYCVWAKGAVSLLPQTDKVGFFEEGSQPQLADWERVREVCGHLMQPRNWYPERFFVEDYPTPQELSEMGAVKILP